MEENNDQSKNEQSKQGSQSNSGSQSNTGSQSNQGSASAQSNQSAASAASAASDENNSSKQSNSSTGSNNDQSKNWLEWLVFGVSSLLVVGVLGYLSVIAIRSEPTSPAITVRLGSSEKAPSGWTVPVTVRNGGNTAAERLSVNVELTLPGSAPETAAMELAYLARGESRRGYVGFTDDPSNGRLRAWVSGYETP